MRTFHIGAEETNMKGLLLVLLLVVLVAFVSASGCGCNKGDKETVTCTGDSCKAASAEDVNQILVQRTQDYWYSMWKKEPELYDKVTSYFTDDVELYAYGSLIVKGKPHLSQAIRMNGIVLYNNYIIEDFKAWPSADHTACWAQMRRGIRNLNTHEGGIALYTARLEFTPDHKISAVHEFPNYEQSSVYLPQVVPNMKGSLEFYMCQLINVYCPTLDWGSDDKGEKKTCYQAIANYRDADPDFAPRFMGASKRCIAINLQSLSQQSAPMVCPLFAKGNGSPMGCWDM